mmetsp:Transcript_20215/g.53022  ORF Transcript_20215/g.53022 Transcript_20215/m.53022 type:complete len:204 (+) Transcript_20215:351-962(+)
MAAFLMRSRLAMSTGSLSSLSALTTSTSTTSSWLIKSSSTSFTLSVAWMLFSAVLMFLSKSIDIWCRSAAMAGPRIRAQPRKNTSIFMEPVRSSSSIAKSRSRSLMGSSSTCIRRRTFGFRTASTNSSYSKLLLPSVSASTKIVLNDSIIFASIVRFSFPSDSSFARALFSTFSTTMPMIPLRRPKTVRHKKGTTRTIKRGLC